MMQILLHLIGDFVLQNDWMAANKRKMDNKGWLACLIHCTLYSIPFGLYYQNPTVFAAVFLSHFFIDKFGLAEYWVKLVNWNWASTNYGFDNDKPKFLSVWLYILIDNTFHLACNYAAITYLMQ